MTKKKRSHSTSPGHASKPPSIGSLQEKAFGSGLLEKFLNNYGIYIALSLVLVMSLIIFRDYLLFQKIFLFQDIGSDSITGYYPNLFHIAEYLKTDGIPRWSFNQGMGQNIFPICFYDPFSLLLVLLGKSNIAYGVVYVIILKIICASLLFYLFLRKLSVPGIVAILGAISYGFSGFNIVAGQWQNFSAETVVIALLLYSFEKLYQDDNWWLFPLAVTATMIVQPVFMYLHGVLLAIYIVVRLIEDGAWKPEKWAPLMAKLTGLGTLGILISAFIAIALLQEMLNSPRVGGNASYHQLMASSPIFGFADAWQNITSLTRLFSDDLIGIGSKFQGWGNYLEAPLYYCGLVNLLLIPQLFSFLDKKHRILYTLLLAIFAVPAVFPFFRHALWLFSGDYFRGFGLLVVVILLFCAARAFSAIVRTNRINIALLFTTLAVLIAALHLPYPIDKAHPVIIDESLRFIIDGLLIGYACLLTLLSFPKIKTIVLSLIVASSCVELAYSACLAADTRPVITDEIVKNRAWYNDITNDATDYLHKIDGSFYRVHKNYPSGTAMHYSINDAKVQHFFGLLSYHSFNQINYVRFLGEMGLIDDSNEWQTRWIGPSIAYEKRLHSFVSLKYLLWKGSGLNWKALQLDSIATFGDISVYKNLDYLPLGYTFDKYMPYAEFHPLSKEQKVVALQKAFIIKDDSAIKNRFPMLAVSEAVAPYPLENYKADLALRRADTLAIDTFRQNFIRGSITTSGSKMLFFSIPFDKGWTAKIDGVRAKIYLVDIGFMGIPLERGSHSVELRYCPPHFFLGLWISIAAILVYIITMKAKTTIDMKRRDAAAAQ